jgi:hypothetical protein
MEDMRVSVWRERVTENREVQERTLKVGKWGHFWSRIM